MFLVLKVQLAVNMLGCLFRVACLGRSAGHGMVVERYAGFQEGGIESGMRLDARPITSSEAL